MTMKEKKLLLLGSTGSVGSPGGGRCTGTGVFGPCNLRKKQCAHGRGSDT